MNAYFAEFFGTALLILLGNGVVANVCLNKTKGQSSGWIVITTAWAFAVYVAVVVTGPYSGAHLNPAVTLGVALKGAFAWELVPGYIVAQVVGGMVGALLVYIMYKDHFTESEGNVNPIAIRNIFSTNPNCRNLPRNFFVETLATTVFLSAILAVATKYETQLPIGVGLIVWAVGMGLGGTTGFAMNQARDLGPRLAFQLLPIKNKANNDWQYGLLVPGIAPFVGALLAALFCHLFLGI